MARTAFVPELNKWRSLYDHPSLEKAVASLSVYRTYVEPDTGRVAELDRAVLAHIDEPLRRVLLLQDRGFEEFVIRFQQTTVAVMAKGVEDTAFYRYLRLVALNEVGGDPGRFSLSVEEFHRRNISRATMLPQQMLASETHDTKRSGDVRARIGALAELAMEWGILVRRWRAQNRHLRTGSGPDPNEEYLIYQTLVGTWPIARDRLCAHLEKALREAKVNTRWDEPNAAWERSVADFATALYDNDEFRRSFEPFVRRVMRIGEDAALGALLLRLTCPGFPDIYQGDEMWSLELVDPDNRRPVDWSVVRGALMSLGPGDRSCARTRKLELIRHVLRLRARHPGPFAGDYTPLPARSDVCAFARGDEVAVIVGLRGDSDVGAVELPVGSWIGFRRILRVSRRSDCCGAADGVAVAFGDGERVDPFVELDSIVALDENPLDLVARNFDEQLLPELAILDGLLRGVAPAVRLPRGQPPLGEAVHHVAGIKVDLHPAASGQRAKPFDDAHQLHPVVRRVALAAAQLALSGAHDEQRGPAAGSWIA